MEYLPCFFSCRCHSNVCISTRALICQSLHHISGVYWEWGVFCKLYSFHKWSVWEWEQCCTSLFRYKTLSLRNSIVYIQYIDTCMKLSLAVIIKCKLLCQNIYMLHKSPIINQYICYLTIQGYTKVYKKHWKSVDNLCILEQTIKHFLDLGWCMVHCLFTSVVITQKCWLVIW